MLADAAERTRASSCRTRSSPIDRSSPGAPGSATTAQPPIRLTGAMSSTLDLPDADWESRPAERRAGRARTTSSRRRLRPGPPVGRQRPRRRRVTSTTRSSPSVARRRPRIRGRGLSASASSTRATSSPRPRSASFDTTRGAARHQPERPSPGRSNPATLFTTPEADHRLLGRRARRDERRVPRALSRASGAREVARRAAAGPAQHLGGDLLRLRRGEAARDRDLGARPRRRAVRARRRLVRRSATRTIRRSATGSSIGASCPAASTALAREVEALGLTFGLWIEPEMVSRRSRLFEAHPDWAIGIPGRPRTESRAAATSSIMSRPEIVDHLAGVLSESLSSAPISYVKWDMNRTITEPYSLGLAARSPGRVLPPLHPRRLRPVRPADDGLPGCPVRVVRRRRRAVRPGDARLRATGLDERRHRCDRAAARSSGGPRWSTRSARWAPTSPRSRTTRPAGSPRSTRGPRWRSSGSSATSWIRPR